MDIKELILELENIRNLPQFVFFDTVSPISAIQARQSVIEFKKDKGEIGEVDLIIHSPGGSPDEAYRIIRTFRKNFKKINCIIPFWAKSAATLMALGGSEIIMDEYGEFGPLDAQIGKRGEDGPHFVRESALNDEHSLRVIEERFQEMFESMFVRIYGHQDINIPRSELSKQLLDNLSKFYDPLVSQINPYKLGEKRRILDIGGNYAKTILTQAQQDIDVITQFVHYLVHECPDHGFVVDYDIVRAFDLANIKSSSDVSNKYADVLQELSMALMLKDVTYVGFVEDEELPNLESEEESTITDAKKENQNGTDRKSKTGTPKKANSE